jgi:hypothetical protein
MDMRIYRVLFLLPVLMVLMAAGPATPAGTRKAECVVDVWSNLDFREALYTGHATYAFDDVKAALCREMGTQAHEMLWIAPETLTECVTFEPTPGNDPKNSITLGDGSSPQRSRLTLSITLDEKAQPLAREFLDKMIAALPDVIDQMQRRDISRQMQLVVQVRGELAEQKGRAKQSMEILRGMGMNGRSEADILALTRGLDQQTLQMKLDVAALSAERDVLAKTVTQIDADAAQKAHDDPVAAELEKIVSLKQSMLASLVALQKVGNASPGELSNAESAAAEAHVQLLERRETVERSAGGDELGDLQKQLVQVEVNLAQDMARVDAIGKQSDVLNKALDLQTGMDDLPPGVDASDAKLGELQRELDEIPKAVVRVVSEE